MEFKKLPKSDWSFAACDNPNCPMVGEGIQPMYSNGERTYCILCLGLRK